MARATPFPEWLQKPWPVRYDTSTKQILEGLKLTTVCQSAECPNLGECWHKGTATFMILGESCTRACGFCAVTTGRGEDMAALADEPQRVAEATKKLGLKHVVVTSVARDDLPDEGAGHFKRVIEALRDIGGSGLVIEVLVPDFHARDECLKTVVQAGPDVFNHNTETIERLQRSVRPQGDYRRSLSVLRKVKDQVPQMTTKSGLMVGLGETNEEVRICMNDLREAGCDILTIGQYLRPSKTHLPVAEYVTPETFEAYQKYAMEIGFKNAACGPFVRSSYQAESVLSEAK